MFHGKRFGRRVKLCWCEVSFGRAFGPACDALLLTEQGEHVRIL